MTAEQIPITRHERSARRWRSDARRTRVRRVDAAREWLGRFTPKRVNRDRDKVRRT